MADYPEHERLKEVRGQSQAIGNFIEWLNDKGLPICQHHEGPQFRPDGEYLPYGRRTEDVLAEYFDIDLQKLEAEKQAMLDEMRAAS